MRQPVAADAGVQRAILDLSTSRQNRSSKVTETEDKKIPTDGTIYNWQFGNNTILISVQDERRKVNLNQAQRALLNALFGFAGVDRGTASALADAVADFRDGDNLERIQGAEEADYRAAGLNWIPKNSRFEVVEELQQVLGMTAQIYERVAPYLTIYSIPINPSLANEQLTAIFSNGSPDLESFISSPGTIYSIRAEARASKGAVFVRETVVQAIPNSTIPVRVLAWQEGG
jgi:general secretion pathway protein K